MEVAITDFNHTGEGIGRIDGKIIFIPKTIPGDIVLVKDIKDFKTYYKGNLDKVITPSPERITPKCKYYDLCGGCDLLNINYSNQLSYKQNKVKNILKKYASLDTDLKILPSPKEYGYRNKITLQVVDGKLGLYEQNSNNLVEIDNCLLVSPNVNNLIKIIKNNLDLSLVSNIMIREYDANLMIQFIGNINKSNVINNLSKYTKVIYLNDLLLYGDKNLEVKLGNYKYKVSPYSFFQVNYEAATILYDKVIEYLGPNNNKVLDLYCGTASIGIYISKYCKEITGIEINSSSVKDANENIKLNNLNNIKVLKGDVGALLTTKEEYDAIIVDPPRSGLDKKTKETLLKIKSKKIIYVSCDPITLARDLNILKELYDIKDIILVDMFPNTYHVESIVLLNLK